MEKMLYFAKILANMIMRAYESFYDAGYKLLNTSGTYDMFSGTTLRLKGNKYVFLEDLYGFVEFDEILEMVYVDERYKEDENVLENYNDDELENLVGILFPNDALYEILYDFGMLGESFHDEKKDKEVKQLLKRIYKAAGVFDYDLHFQDGRIYITFEKKPLDDGSFACRDMMEVEVVYQLRKGVGLIEAREAAGMSEEEFKSFMERLREHEWKQTSACEDEARMEELKQRGWK